MNKKLNIETLTKESERVFHGKEKERGRSFENPEIQGKERWRLTMKGVFGFRAFFKAHVFIRKLSVQKTLPKNFKTQKMGTTFKRRNWV